MKHHSPEADIYMDRILYWLRNQSSYERPVTSKKLQNVLGTNDVTIRQSIGLLRDNGYPIGSGPKGFFLAKKPRELESTIDNLQERIAVISRRRALLISAQNKMRTGPNGQGLLEF